MLFFHMRCVLLFLGLQYIVKILSNVSVFVCECVEIELVKALVQSGCRLLLYLRETGTYAKTYIRKNTNA